MSGERTGQEIYDAMLEYGACVLIAFAYEDISNNEVLEWIQGTEDNGKDDELYPTTFTLDEVAMHIDDIVDLHNESAAEARRVHDGAKAISITHDDILRTQKSLLQAIHDSGGHISLEDLGAMTLDEFIEEVAGRNIIFVYSKVEKGTEDGQK